MIKNVTSEKIFPNVPEKKDKTDQQNWVQISSSGLHNILGSLFSTFRHIFFWYIIDILRFLYMQSIISYTLKRSVFFIRGTEGVATFSHGLSKNTR